ncbi:hypothetical protein [Streptomyces griseomycini]|uniref:Secreted protein/lipoprotein n=1 Tax=Streptomyces griseomycini TaxID=66895 RepID=A0A7W7PXV5_9ACTN|nr:hypothetical protein [Streptomyces griseomycini]MBB4903274.1 hypothetical protein [Streptomyces griseomycini]
MTRTQPRSSQPAAVRLRNWAAASVALSAVLALSACSSDNNGKAPVETSSAPTPSPTVSVDPAEAAKKEAIATYQGYWQEMEKLYADRSGAGADLKKYAALAALKNATADAKRTHERGLINIGDVRVTDPVVTKYDAKGKIPNATVSSCLDISRWQTVDADTEKPVTLPSNRLTKYLIVSTLEKWPEGWRVIRDDPQGKPC